MTKTLRTPLLLIAILLTPIGSALSSQETLSAPFVSRLETTINGPEVVLTWIDQPRNVNEVYEVLRSPEPINADSLESCESITMVARGIQGFADRPPVNRDWWYAVLVVEESGRRDVLIDYRNVTVNPVVIESWRLENSEAAHVLRLHTEIDNRSVVLSFLADRPDRSFLLLRNTRSMETSTDLAQSVVVATLTGSRGSYRDDPVPGIDWYYAMLDEVYFRSNPRDLSDFVTRSPPITIPIGTVHTEERRFERVLRSSPLPAVRVTRRLLDGQPTENFTGELPTRSQLLAQTDSAVQTILSAIAEPPRLAKQVEILNLDRIESISRKTRELYAIVHGPFAAQEWQTADDQFFALEAANDINDDLRARILFYRGQCAFFLGEYHLAYLHFLSSRRVHYQESQAWMESLAELALE